MRGATNLYLMVLYEACVCRGVVGVCSAPGLSLQRETGRLTMLWTRTLEMLCVCQSLRFPKPLDPRNNPSCRTISFTRPDSLNSSIRKSILTGNGVRAHLFDVYNHVSVVTVYMCSKLWFTPGVLPAVSLSFFCRKSINYHVPFNVDVENPEEWQKSEQEKIDTAETLSDEQAAEKDELLQSGFSDWSRRDFNQFVRAVGEYGRENVEKISTEVEGKEPANVRRLSVYLLTNNCVHD